jgi:carbon storage regulator CsrA
MSRLVLTRRLNESVVIHRDNEIIATVKLCRIDRNSVRIAFVADHKTTIDRQEVFDGEQPCHKEEKQG